MYMSCSPDRGREFQFETNNFQPPNGTTKAHNVFLNISQMNLHHELEWKLKHSRALNPHAKDVLLNELTQ